MPIFAISDLHLCDKGPRDNFIVRGEDRLLRFLDYVADQDGDLWILGDLLEFWQCNIGKCIQAYLPLLQQLKAAGASYIPGNHDNAFTALEGSGYLSAIPVIGCGHSSVWTPTIGGRRFLFCHGHQADPTCRDLNPGIGTITAIMSGMLEDRNKGPVQHGCTIEDAFITSLEAPLNLWRYLSRQSKRRDELLNGIEAFRHEKNAGVVIYGHTHEVGRIRYQHYNCGCWCRDRDTFVRVEDDGSVYLCEWTGTQAIDFDYVLR